MTLLADCMLDSVPWLHFILFGTEKGNERENEWMLSWLSVSWKSWIVSHPNWCHFDLSINWLSASEGGMCTSVSSFSINITFCGKLSLVELVSFVGSFINASDTSGIPRTYSGPPKVENHSQIRHENPGSYKSGSCKQRKSMWQFTLLLFKWKTNIKLLKAYKYIIRQYLKGKW